MFSCSYCRYNIPNKSQTGIEFADLVRRQGLGLGTSIMQLLNTRKLPAPVVKFGPGGDYQHPWPAADSVLGDQELGFFGLIGNILGLVATAGVRTYQALVDKIRPRYAHTSSVGPNYKLISPSMFAAATLGSCCSVNLWRDSNVPGKAKKPFPLRHPDSQTITDSAINRRLSPQLWLFPDFAGVGPQIAAKQSHRLRARRIPRPKRNLTPLAQQGTLFDD